MPEQDHKKVQPSSSADLGTRKQSKFRRDRRIVRLCKFLNGPLFATIFGGLLVSLLVFFISNHIQERFSASQQKFQVEQGKRANKINSASAAEEEIIRALGKRFIGIAVELAAYREHYEHQQYEENVDYHNASKREWEFNYEVTKLKVKIYFSDPKIQELWNHLAVVYCEDSSKPDLKLSVFPLSHSSAGNYIHSLFPKHVLPHFRRITIHK